MNRYEIWMAKVKFEDTEGVKERPVMIWNDQYYLIAYKMTGTDRGDNQDEYRVKYWREAGLSKPTSIRIRKVLRLEKSDLIRKLGELDRRERLSFDFRIVP